MAPPIAVFERDYTMPKGYTSGTHRTRSPATTFADYARLMPALGITRVANVTGLDHIGLPVYTAIRPTSRSLAVSQGKGLDAAAAKASALMESIEAWHAELAALNRFVRREMQDVKRTDALKLLHHLARMVTPEAAPHQPGFRFESTSFWVQMTKEIAARHGAVLDMGADHGLPETVHEPHAMNGSAHTPVVDLLPEQVEDLWDQCRADPILRQALDRAGTTIHAEVGN